MFLYTFMSIAVFYCYNRTQVCAVLHSLISTVSEMAAVNGGADNLTTERGKNQPVFGEAEPATVRSRAESDVFLSGSP